MVGSLEEKSGRVRNLALVKAMLNSCATHGLLGKSSFRVIVLFLVLGLCFVQVGCMTAYQTSVGANTEQTFERVYFTDFNTAWQAVLDSLKSSRLDVKDREGGVIQTRWTENTAEKNFVESFGGANAFLKAEYRFRVTVSKGFYNGKPSVKVSVQKEQVVQRDVLEGRRPVSSDSYDENTLLYRIGRIIYLRTKLAKLEEDRTKRAMEHIGVDQPPKE
jgi:hypothetical protein